MFHHHAFLTTFPLRSSMLFIIIVSKKIVNVDKDMENTNAKTIDAEVINKPSYAQVAVMPFFFLQTNNFKTLLEHF